MTTLTSFGNITLAEYKRITGPRPSWRRRLALVAAAGGACLTLFAAVDFLSVWTGKHAHLLPVATAEDVLDEEPEEQWQKDGAMSTLSVEIDRLVVRLAEVAKKDPGSAPYASGYLMNSALLIITELKRIQHPNLAPQMTNFFTEVQKQAR